MKAFLKKYYKKIIILSSDLACLIAALVCAPLSEALLRDTDQVCVWMRFGGQCVTCGGTHFVNDLLSGRIGEAFSDNQLLFVLTVYALLTLIALNLWLLFDLAFAKEVLSRMYSIPSLIVFCVLFFAFLFWRNWNAIRNAVQLLTTYLQGNPIS